MKARRTRGKATMLLTSAALSGGAVLAPAECAQAETPAARSPRVEGSKEPKFAACTAAQIVANAQAAARTLLAVAKDVAKVPDEARYLACKIGNSKGPMYDGTCKDAMVAVYAEKPK
jgi:hypothetical protein